MNTMQAVRAFHRIWEPIATDLDIGAAADHQFDGGEWSDAASCEIHQEIREKLLEAVAGRFGLTSAQLDYAIEKQAHEQAWREWELRK